MRVKAILLPEEEDRLCDGVIPMRETGQARRPPLPATSIEPPCRRQGGLITYQEGRYER
jgi:hypothetical protein